MLIKLFKKQIYQKHTTPNLSTNVQNSPLTPSTDIAEYLYSLMPPAGRMGFWKSIFHGLLKVGEVKPSSDIIAFVLKILPGAATAIIIPTLVVTALIFRNSVIAIETATPQLFWIIISCIATITLSFVISIVVNNRLHRKLLASDLHHDFDIVQYVVAGHIISETKAIYTFRYLVSPRRGGINRFPLIFNWSGEGGVTVVPRNSRFSATAPIKTTGNYSKSEIIFDQEIRKDSEVIIEYAVITADSKEVKPSRHLGMVITSKKYPFFNTHIIISFDQSCIPISVSREKYLGGFTLSSVDSRIVSLKADRSHHWRIKRVFNWSYCIAWDFGR